MDIALVNVVWVGLVATTVFSMLMYGGPMMGMPKMDIATVIGTMVLPKGIAAFVLGMKMHFIIGIIFTLIYAAVWGGFDWVPTWWNGILFGLVHAMVAAMGLKMMMGMHKAVKAGDIPDPLAGGAKGVVGMVMGHAVFGLLVGLLYTPA